jgi:hypothetical protein
VNQQLILYFVGAYSFLRRPSYSLRSFAGSVSRFEISDICIDSQEGDPLF